MTREAHWYADWQHEAHASRFDGRHRLNGKNLMRNYESLNDVRLLNAWIERSRALALVEVGCATGEFYRYLQQRYPSVRYYGLDIAEPAIARARAKYGSAKFLVTRPDATLRQALRELGVAGVPEVVYAKDVLHHQTKPFEFLAELLSLAGEALVMRCRTRDVGATELDPEKSCQHHYGGWMPYIVVNLQELVEAITMEAPDAEIVVRRNHMVLGGWNERFLPKDCYLPETGTAETAVGVFRKTGSPRRVTIEDRPDGNPRYTIGHQLRRGLRRLAGAVSGR